MQNSTKARANRRPSATPLEFQHLALLLQRPVAYHPIFAKITKSANAGLMLSQAFFWTKILDATEPHRDGWFHKTREQWFNETCLTRREQETARKRLRELGLLEERREGIPAQLFYKLNKQMLLDLLNSYLPDAPTDLPPPREAESAPPVGTKTPNKAGANGQSLKEHRPPHALRREKERTWQEIQSALTPEQAERLEWETDEMASTPAGAHMLRTQGRERLEEMIYRSWHQ